MRRDARRCTSRRPCSRTASLDVSAKTRIESTGRHLRRASRGQAKVGAEYVAADGPRTLRCSGRSGSTRSAASADAVAVRRGTRSHPPHTRVRSKLPRSVAILGQRQIAAACLATTRNRSSPGRPRIWCNIVAHLERPFDVSGIAGHQSLQRTARNSLRLPLPIDALPSREISS